MAPQPSIKIVKTLPYQGGTKEWSNRYHFTGGVPPDTAAWTAFADAVVAAEKGGMFTDLSIHEVLGYDVGSDVPVFGKTYDVAGTYAPSTRIAVPGDCAICVRFSTTQRSVKNHPIYLFKFYHGVRIDAGGNGQVPSGSWLTDFMAIPNLWVSGFSVGGVTRKYCGPNGAVAQDATRPTYIRHRDFPT